MERSYNNSDLCFGDFIPRGELPENILACSFTLIHHLPISHPIEIFRFVFKNMNNFESMKGFSVTHTLVRISSKIAFL